MPLPLRLPESIKALGVAWIWGDQDRAGSGDWRPDSVFTLKLVGLLKRVGRVGPGDGELSVDGGQVNILGHRRRDAIADQLEVEAHVRAGDVRLVDFDCD